MRPFWVGSWRTPGWGQVNQKGQVMIRSMDLSALPLALTTFLVTRGLRGTFCYPGIVTNAQIFLNLSLVEYQDQTQSFLSF